MTPIFACLPVFTFFAALGLLAVAVVLFGAYNRDEPSAPVAEAKRAELTWQWVVAIVITIVVPLLMLMGIWLLPEW